MTQLTRLVDRGRALMPFSDRAGGETLLIAGAGRSGTTWLAELATADPGTRLVFEPFKPGCSAESDQFAHRQYLPIDAHDTALRAPLAQILQGRIRSRWTDRYNRAFVYRRRVVKAIRANLLLGWIAQNLPQVRIAFVVRNPLDTVASQAQGGWPLDLKKLVQQERLTQDWLEVFTPLIDACTPGFQANLVHWCVENHVPLQQFDRLSAEAAGRVAVFAYERLRDDPANLEGFLDFCGVADIAGALERAHVPSRVSRGKTSFTAPDPATQLSAEDSAFADHCLRQFGLQHWAGM